LTALCAVIAWVGVAAPALAAGHPQKAQKAQKVSDAVGLKVLNDCQAHGQFTQDWTHAELEKALSMVSAMTNQYSSCSDDLHRALASGIKVNVSGGSGGGSGTTIVVVIVAVLVVLAALLGGLGLRRRGQSGGPPPTAA
jgi:hypothetical protein